MPGLSNTGKHTQGFLQARQASYQRNSMPSLHPLSLRSQTSVPFTVPGKRAQHGPITILAICGRRRLGKKRGEERKNVHTSRRGSEL